MSEAPDPRTAGRADPPEARVTLYRGGHVYTPVSPRATALLVDGNQIAWVGEEAAVNSFPAEVTVDLHGAFVAPAFVDAHVPLLAAGLLAMSLDLSLTASLPEALVEIERAAARSSCPPVLIASGCSAARWPGGRLPSAGELEARAAGRLVYLLNYDPVSGLPTSGVASPALLRAAHEGGIDPAGDGLCTGIAHEHVWERLSALTDRSQRLAAYGAAGAAAARAGVAAVHSFAPPGPAGASQAAELVAAGRDPAHAGMAAVGPVYWPAELEQATRVGARPGGFVVDHPAVEGYGLAAGGAPPDRHSVARAVAAASRAGVQTSWVARGAEAVGEVVAGVARAAEEVGLAPVRASAHRIEAVESIDERDLPRLSELGLVVVACPRSGRVLASAAPLAALAAAGVPLAFGGGAASAPYPIDPWATVRAAVRSPAPSGAQSSGAQSSGAQSSGVLPSAALSARAAFAASTRGGWRAARQDGDGTGQLAPGSPAMVAIWEIQGELAVQAPDRRVAAWSTDPRAGVGGLPDLDGPAPRCVRTLINGGVVYDDGTLHQGVPGTA